MAKRQLDVEIRGDNRNLKKSVKDTEKTTNSFTNTVKKAGVALLAAFAAKKIIGGIKNLITNLTETADRLLDLKDITGLSTDALQEYEYISKIAGVNTEAIASAAQNLTNRFQNLYRESSPISRAFREMGIEAHKANGELRATDEIMDEALVALAEMTNQTERNALAAQIFGGSWKDLAPILSMGKDGIEDLRKEAHDLGIVMGEDAIREADEFRQEMVRLESATEALKREIGTQLIPVLSSMAEGINEAISGWREFDAALEQSAERGGMSKMEGFLRSFHVGWTGMFKKLGLDFFGLGEKEMERQITKMSDAFTEAHQKMRQEMAQLDMIISKAVLTGEYENEVIQESIKERNKLAKALGEEAEWREYLTEVIEQGIEDQLQADVERYGTLELLEQQLAEQKQLYQTAHDEQAAALHQKRIWELEQQIAKLKELRELAAIEMWLEQHEMPGMEGVEPMESIEPTDWLGRFQDDHDTTMDEVIDKEKDTADELVDIWDTAGNEIAHNLSFAFAEALSLIGRELETGEADWHEYVSNVLRSISQLLVGLLAQAIAGMIAGEVSSKGVAGLAVATVGVAALGALWESSVPKFEEGVIATGPTLGIFGEYATARTDPEIAGKFSDFERMMGNSGGGTYEFVIKGNTLHGVLQRESTRRNQLG